MDRPDYIDLFSVPGDYKPPDDNNLSKNTEYPNLNSKDYRKKLVDRFPKLHPFFEAVAVNDEGECVLASNNIRGRIWDGCIWGFKDITVAGDEMQGAFKFYCQSPITNIKYIKSNIFILSETGGSVQVWSTKSEIRNSKDYCPFMIGEKTEHAGIILSMDVFQSDVTKAITGSNDCCLKIWDTGAGDLFSVHTLRFAHSDAITGISCNPSLESTFATCSRDKSALIWDYREARPATALYEEHKFPFTSIYWSRIEEKEQTIVLGDEAGSVCCVDPRVPNKFIDAITVFNRPIRRTRFNLNQMAVIGNTNIVKVYKCTKSNKYELLYKDSQANNLIRDCVWNTWAENELYTTGWDKKFTKHVIE